MAKERTLIGIQLKEFLDCIREKIQPDDWRREGNSYYIGEYCLSSKPDTLVKTGDDGWSINFTDMYGQYYSTLAPLLRICLIETDIREKAEEFCKLDGNLDEMFKGAMKLELMDEMGKTISTNYSKSVPEILEQAQEILDSYKDLL